MSRKTNRELHDQEKTIQNLEARLQQALHPISPRPEFVSQLRYQLEYRASSPQKAEELSLVQFLLIALVSVISGTVLVILGIKSIVVLLDVLGLHHRDPHPMDSEQPAPLQQAA
jgi:hypothetical protein